MEICPHCFSPVQVLRVSLRDPSLKFWIIHYLCPNCRILFEESYNGIINETLVRSYSSYLYRWRKIAVPFGYKIRVYWEIIEVFLLLSVTWPVCWLANITRKRNLAYRD